MLSKYEDYRHYSIHIFGKINCNYAIILCRKKFEIYIKFFVGRLLDENI